MTCPLPAAPSSWTCPLCGWVSWEAGAAPVPITCPRCLSRGPFLFTPRGTMSATGNPNQKIPKDPLGRYQTPPHLVDACLLALFADVLVHRPGPFVVLDAGAGQGGFSVGLGIAGDVLQVSHVIAVDVDRLALDSATKSWVELTSGGQIPAARRLVGVLGDFLKFRKDQVQMQVQMKETGRQGVLRTQTLLPDVVVMNPPFHLWEDFTAKALDLVPEGWVGVLIRSSVLSNRSPLDRGLWRRLFKVHGLVPRPGFLLPVYPDHVVADLVKEGEWTAVPEVEEYKAKGSDASGYVWVVFGPSKGAPYPVAWDFLDTSP